MKFLNYLNDFVFYSPDGEDGATGGADTGEGTGEQSTATQTLKFGGIEVDPSDPKSIAKAQEAYVNMQKSYTQANQKLKALEGKTGTKLDAPKPDTKNTNVDETMQKRMEFMYEENLNNKLETLKQNSVKKMKSDYGEETYEKAKDDFEKKLSKLGNLKLDQKEQLIKSGDLSFMFNSSLAKALKKTGETPNPKKDLNNFKENEDLPPNPGQSDGTNVPGDTDPEKLYAGDDNFKKAKEMARKARAIRRGEGVRGK